MKKFFYLLFCLVLFSCNKGTNEEPVIPRQKFVSLLIRMHLLDARISFDQVVDPNSVNEHYARYETLLKQYQTDSTTLSRTFDFYRDRQDELISIYQEVQDSLVERAKATVKPK